jgi:glucose/arabinose dehydrogenase
MRIALWLWIGMALGATYLPAAASAQQVRAHLLATGLQRPVAIASPPGDTRRLFIAEQHTGDLRIFDLVTDQFRSEPFVTVTGLSFGEEQGLLGLAFHPRFAENGYVFVNFTRADGATVIRRYQASEADPDRAGPDALDLLVIPQPQSNHNGGWLGFGPNDGYLYIGMGDGGNFNDTGTGHTEPGGNAQDLTGNLLGKLLRIDVDADDFPADPARNYAIPPDNPFVGQTGDDEIWAFGLRNPFRCSFDAQAADLYCGDVGQDTREEIDFQPASSSGGENYGWRLREGTIATPGVGGDAPGAVEPIFDYPHAGAEISGNVVTGGVVYRGPAASLRGLYFFADFSTAHIWSFRRDGTSVLDFTDWNDVPGFLPDQGSIGFVSTFGTDITGNVYFANLARGEIFAIGVDGDGDGLIDPVDRCPAFATLDQTDTDANGIGNACECGDQSGDGRLNVSDLIAINQAIFNPSLVTPLCDANGDGRCNVSDIVSVNRDLFTATADTSCARRP